MRKSILACAACLALLTTGCGASLEQTANRNVTQTEVVLAKNNYRVVGMTSGESTQNYILCFGGLSKKSLGESAMAEMYKNANLKGSQAIINTNVCLKSSTYLGLYTTVKAIATGTIIEFCDSSCIGTELSNLTEIKNTISEDPKQKKEYYTLSFYKKGKKATAWELVDEKTVNTTYEEASKEADDWGKKSNTITEYMCGIKRAKS